MRDREIKNSVNRKGSIIMFRRKTREEKLGIVKEFISGAISLSEAGRKVGVDPETVSDWIMRYEQDGIQAFVPGQKTRKYSKEQKRQAVEEYLAGGSSLREICQRHNISGKSILRKWIKVYNSGRDFSRKMSGGSRMKEARKTTQTERIEIAKACLENGCNYGETAIQYNVSYQQVYTWVKKFRELGEAGLEDRRGRRTAQQEPRTEEEELRVRIAQLEHELYMTKMERDLLKKLDEIERRDAFRK